MIEPPESPDFYIQKLGLEHIDWLFWITFDPLGVYSNILILIKSVVDDSLFLADISIFQTVPYSFCLEDIFDNRKHADYHLYLLLGSVQ